MNYDINKEKEETIRAGERALVSLNDALSQLNGARTWGMIDILGGSFISSAIKRGRLKRTQESLNRADRELTAFCDELRDVGRLTSINVDISDILGLADLFCENFLVDLLMQDRIRTADRRVRGAINEVEDALWQLRRL